MKNLLSINKISKSFIQYSSEYKRILSWFGIPSNSISEINVLENISFTIKEGESVGILGQNGAGKSTLLKIITGTLAPSSGNVIMNGRISAILELGMGFHPDLTGRQNVYHSAGLMGFIESQVDSVIDEIESFAEINEYFDQPVRLYSSGMQVRVAFSIATAFRPEVLIIDEALSVGDAYFQHKCFERIKNFKDQGTSLLFVSHDKSAILSLCDRAILLEKGNIIKDANPEEVLDFYNALIAKKETTTIRQEVGKTGKMETISGTGEATIESIGIYNDKDMILDTVGVGEEVFLKVKVKVNKDIDELVLGYMIKDRLGLDIFGINTHHLDAKVYNLKCGQKIIFSFLFPVNIGVGSYSLTLALHKGDTHLVNNYEWRDKAYIFSVVNVRQRAFSGNAWIEPKVDYYYE